MRELQAVDVAFHQTIDLEDFGYVRKVLCDEDPCWGLFDSVGEVIFVGDEADDCFFFAFHEDIRIQSIH